MLYPAASDPARYPTVTPLGGAAGGWRLRCPPCKVQRVTADEAEMRTFARDHLVVIPNPKPVGGRVA